MKRSNANNIFTISVLIFAASIFSTCERKNKAITESDWKLESVRGHADSTFLYPLPHESFVLSFESSENEIRFQLRSSACTGKAKFKSQNEISFYEYHCSTFCCEPTDAFLASVILLDVSIYTLKENLLTMATDDGRIVNFIRI